MTPVFRWRRLASLVVFSLVACDSTDPSAVALVDEASISRAMLERELGASLDTAKPDQITAALNRLVAKAQLAAVARRDELDTQPNVRAELETARLEILARAARKASLKPVSAEALGERAEALKLDAIEQEAELRMIRVAIQSDPKGDPERPRLEAEARADTAYARIRSGEPFAVVAADVSDDKLSAARGGSLGWVKASRIDPRLFDAALALTPDTPTVPIETNHGFFIMQVDGPPREAAPSRATLEARARAQLRAEADAELREATAKRFPATILLPRGDN